MKPIEIVPAILPVDFAEISDKAVQVRTVATSVQIDICDGQFVSSITWPFQNDNRDMEKILSQEEGLPAWQELDYELDLMVNWKKPEDVERWVNFGASRLIFHVESKGDLKTIVKTAAVNVDVGMALNIDTDISRLDDYISDIKFVQLMGIDHIGFQGQSFDPKVIEKIRLVRAKYPELPISVDGGVTLSNAKDLIEAGATRLVVGSAIFSSDNVVETVEMFQGLGES